MGDSFLKLQEMCSFSQNVCIEVYGILNTRLTPNGSLFAPVGDNNLPLSDFSRWIRLCNGSSYNTRGFNCPFQVRSPKGFFLIFRKHPDTEWTICLFLELRGRLFSDAIVSVHKWRFDT